MGSLAAMAETGGTASASPERGRLRYTPSRRTRRRATRALARHSAVRGMAGQKYRQSNASTLREKWPRRELAGAPANVVARFPSRRRPAASIERTPRTGASVFARGGGSLPRARVVRLRRLLRGHPQLGEFLPCDDLPGIELQRRLDAHNTTFNDLLEEVRLALAKEFLANPRLGLKEVAYRVGYSDLTTFIRAFKRATGTTPLEYRNRIVPET